MLIRKADWPLLLSWGTSPAFVNTSPGAVPGAGSPLRIIGNKLFCSSAAQTPRLLVLLIPEPVMSARNPVRPLPLMFGVYAPRKVTPENPGTGSPLRTTSDNPPARSIQVPTLFVLLRPGPVRPPRIIALPSCVNDGKV